MPAKYFEAASRPRHFGYFSLGQQINYEREQWASSWPEVDGWMLNQLRQSPLSVVEEADADIVIVPVFLRVGKPTNPNDPFTALQVHPGPTLEVFQTCNPKGFLSRI